jgi:hypothetical protein
MKIAVASDNWLSVDRSLEKDGQFIILKIIKGKVELDGVRTMNWAENEVYSLLADCNVILCRHSEAATKKSLENNGFTVIITHGPIYQIINDYLQYFLLQDIIDKKQKQKLNKSFDLTIVYPRQ